MSLTQRTILFANPGAELYGSDRVLLESVSGLVESGWTVAVTLPASGPLVRELQDRGAKVSLRPTPVIRKKILRPRGAVAFLSAAVRGFFAGMCLLSRLKPDVVYVNTMTIPLWIALARLRGIPVISHVHEGESSAPRFMRSALAVPLLFATEIIANSKFSVGVLATSFSCLARRALVIHNGVQGPPSVTPSRKQLDLPLRVIYIGRLSPRKGVDVAIQSIADLAARGVDSRLDIVGDVFVGYEWYEAQLREQVETTALGDQVVFHGFQRSIWPILAAGDVVVVPSRNDEPFGDTAVEAVLSGRRVIASATSGLLEATEGYVSAQTVAPGDASALADALQQTIETWEGTSSQIEADTERAVARHGAEVYRRHIADLVDSIVPIAR